VILSRTWKGGSYLFELIWIKKYFLAGKRINQDENAFFLTRKDLKIIIKKIS